MAESDANSAAIRARALTIGWQDPVLTDVNFDIPNGFTTAVIGPNGSGKSTLLHAMAGLLEPMSGSLEVFGGSAVDAQRDMSYVMQSTPIPKGVPLTVREVVRMGRYSTAGWLRRLGPYDDQRVHEAMERLDVLNLAKRQIGQLSGGQRQRVAVAQGIAQDHRLLILDEPLAGLDLSSMGTIDRIIHDETKHGCTVVLTTHDLDEARAADYVLLVGQGRVVGGRPDAVLTTERLRSAYGLGSHPPLDDMSTELPTPHYPE